MTNINRLKLTWISFFSYALTGALVIVTGIVLKSVANYFQLPPAKMGNTFTFLNSGILLAIFLNVWLMAIVPLKRQLIFGFLLMLAAIVGLMFATNLVTFSICMFVLGIVSGITMSIGTFLITHLYQGRQRGSRLLFTDSFFSMAGMLFPIIASVILSHHLIWYWIYAVIGLLYLAIFILSLSAEFPVLNQQATSNEPLANQPEKWGLGVVFLSLAALCYILGQLGFISWVPSYVTSTFHFTETQAGSLVSAFWTAYMVGMWFFSSILRFFDLQRAVTVQAALATLFMYLFNHLGPEWSYYNIVALGFISSAIYTTLITLGSQQTKVTSPKLVNFILTCGTVGTMLSMVVTSPIVAKHGFHAALVTTNGLYLAVTIFALLLGLVSKHRQYSLPSVAH